MFYISKTRGSYYGVTDSDDAVCEYYTRSKLLDLTSAGIQILGVSKSGDISAITDLDFLRSKCKLLTGKDFKYAFSLDREDEYYILNNQATWYLQSTSTGELIKITNNYIKDQILKNYKLKILNIFAREYKVNRPCDEYDNFTIFFNALNSIEAVAEVLCYQMGKKFYKAYYYRGSIYFYSDNPRSLPCKYDITTGRFGYSSPNSMGVLIWQNKL